MDIQIRKAAGWSAFWRAMRVGHCFSKRILISPCIIYPQPWRYPKAIWTWSWAAGSKWPWLRRKVGTNDIWRSLPASTLIVLLWTSNCMSHSSVLFRTDFASERVDIASEDPDAGFCSQTSHCLLLSQCILLQASSEFRGLNYCIVSEHLHAMYDNQSFVWLFSKSLVQI